jgi:anti-sigma regulatory factor (Ser/Thr protein kinase)
MPDRDHGRSAVATLLTAPTQQLERPTYDLARPIHDRDYSRSSSLRSLEPRKRDKADGWPLRSYLQLGALPGAVPCARLHAKLVLWEWGLDHLVETAELLVSEIVTNAVRAAAGPADGQGETQRPNGVPSVWFWLAADRRNALIQVWDDNPETPSWQEVDPEAESGRGLLLVERLSARWGTYTPDGWTGKVVWAIVGEKRDRLAN